MGLRALVRPKKQVIGAGNRIKSLKTSFGRSFVQTMQIRNGVRISRICSCERDRPPDYQRPCHPHFEESHGIAGAD